MGTSIFTDADLDAMTAEDAWERCCYAAWVTRRHERRLAPVRQAMQEARQQAAEVYLELINKLPPEERERLLKLAERGGGVSMDRMSMDRPSKEQVDAAIDLDSIKYEPLLDAYNVLRSEVRALREELAAAKMFPGAPINQLQTILDTPAYPVAALVKAARELVESADQASAFIAHVHNDRVDALWATLKPFEADWTPLGEAVVTLTTPMYSARITGVKEPEEK